MKPADRAKYRPGALPGMASIAAVRLWIVMITLALLSLAAWAEPEAEDLTEIAVPEQQAIDPELQQQALAADQQVEQLLRARLERMNQLSQVRPEVSAGVVRLSGEVLIEEDRGIAERIAAQTPGVIEVVNAIELSTDLRSRFSIAVENLRHHLFRLVMALPLLLISLALVAFAAWSGAWLAERTHLLRLPGRNPFISTLLRHLLQAVILLIGILVALDIMGATALAGAVIGTAGVAGLALGFAFRDIIENYIASILLSLRQPFSPGDHVVIDSHEGKVTGLSARATSLMTLDGNHLRLPNALVFKGVILNYTRNPLRRFSINTNIGTGNDLRQVSALCLDTLKQTPGVLAEPAPAITATELGSDATTMLMTAWVDQRVNGFGGVRSEAMVRIRQALTAAVIDSGVSSLQVQLQRSSDSGAALPAEGQPGSSAVDTQAVVSAITPGDDIDAQVQRERDEGRDLLDPDAARE